MAGLVWFFTQTKTGQQMWASFTSFLSSAWQTTVEKVTSIGQFIASFFTSTLPSAVQSIGQWFQQLPETIAYWLGYTVTSIALYAAAFAAQALQMGMQFVQNVGTFLMNLPGSIASWLASTAASIGTWAASTAMQALQMGSQFLTNVGTFLAQLPGRVAAWLAGTIASIGGFVSQMGAKAAQAAGQFASNIINGLASLPGRMLSIGANIVNGIVNGIKNKIGSIGSSLLSGVNDALNAVKSKLGIHSPSRVFRDQIGVMIGRGLALGIDDSTAAVAKSMGGLTGMLATPSLPTPYSGGGWRDFARTYSPAYAAPRASGRTVNATYNVYANDPDLVVARISRRQNMLETANGGY